jgi:immune inhibitor A
VLVWYWDTSYGDNNVGDHPGSGLILPVDGRPTLRHWSDGTLMRPRIQAFDATFGTHGTAAFTLHRNSVANPIAAQPANPVFNDLNTYWFATDGHVHSGIQASWNSVNVPHTGTIIRVVSETPGGFTQVQIAPAK